MSNLLIKNINNISLSDICISEYQNYYKINYCKSNLLMNGLSFSCKSEIIKISQTKYFVKLSDQSEKDFINSLDDYLNMKLLNYSRILQKHDKDYGIIFHINNIVSEKFKNFPEKLYLNLKYINKGYYNNPILHIIY